MSRLNGKTGEIRAILRIVRANGKEETVEVVGALDETQLESLRSAHPEAEQKSHDTIGAIAGENAQLKL